MPAFKKDPPTDPTIFDRLGITRDTIPEWLAQYTSDVIPDRTQTEAIAGPPPGDPDAGILGNAWRLARHVVPSLPYAAADVVNAGERLLNRPVVSQDPVAVGDALMVAGAAPLGGVAARAATGAAIPDNAVTPRQASGYSFRPTDAKMLDAGVARDLKRASVREGIANQSPREVFTALRNYSDDMKSAGEGLDGYSLYKDGADTGLGVFGVRDGKLFDVAWIGGRDGTYSTANRLGPGELRSAMRAFREQVPGIRVVEGVRSSGAGPGRTQRVRSEMFANPDDVTTGTVLDAVGRASNLPMDKASRLNRARKLGFDTEQTWYHASPVKDFDEFRTDRIGSTTDSGHIGRGFYFADNAPEADYYAPHVREFMLRGPMMDMGGGGTWPEMFKKWAPQMEEIGALDDYRREALRSIRTIDDLVDKTAQTNTWVMGDKEGVFASMPDPTSPTFNIELRGNNPSFMPKTVDEALDQLRHRAYYELERSPDKFPGLDAIDTFSDWVRTGYRQQDVTDAARRAGYSGIQDGSEVVIFDPRNIRSVNAAFDPAKKDSANLLAANPNDVTTGTLMDAIARQRAATELDRRLQEDGPERWS
jgi:hypothetical protein